MTALPNFASDCKSIKELGQPNGFYLFRNETNGEIQFANCTDGLEETTSLMSNTNIMFSAIIENNCWIGSGYLNGFDRIDFNEGNAFDAAEGKFVAPMDGFYSFSYYAYGESGMYYHIKKNGNDFLRIFGSSTHVFSWQMKLMKNDKVQIYMSSCRRCVCANSNHYIIFNGRLLSEIK